MSGDMKPSMHSDQPAKSTALMAASGELENLAHLCKEIQWAISALLETAHHPDLTVEMHVIQDIDRMQQTLVDLANLVGETAKMVPATMVDDMKLKNAIHLESLRHRLFPNERKIDDQLHQTDDITWF
ncbi:hypothetical protein [Aliiroseovarius lamellibrachiae]|uniref:hypothetical protein n=1 Tax=Aliiroseovarius lamellibrachiae TaxID=1924933 RepID=UPI001BE0566C|nr:hypothetical protein [Aliiroseovarius lamellibrachiae]MBT2132617.1 hypothetical protein [Aliiroseovarius lamellibrachiae]